MGSAAYGRGSRMIRKQLATEQRDARFLFMEELNGLPRYPDARRPFGAVRIAFDQTYQVWWLQDAGRSGRGFWYRDLRELCRQWHMTITGYDETTQLWAAIPRR